MMASQPMACLRICPMNHLSTREWNEAVDRDRLDRTSSEPEPEKLPNRGAKPRRRRGGLLFAVGASLLLTGGLSLGGWGDYALKQQVRATAKQERDYEPSLRVATVEANPATVSVSLPGTTAAFAAANIYARATGYIAKRQVDIGDRVKTGELLAALAVPELDHQISQNEATLDQLKS